MEKYVAGRFQYIANRRIFSILGFFKGMPVFQNEMIKKRLHTVLIKKF